MNAAELRISGSFDPIPVEPPAAAILAEWICLDLAPSRTVYCVPDSSRSISIFHQSILAQLLDPSHPLYAILREGTVQEVWLGPAQAPLRMMLSSERALLSGGARGLPLRAVAFADPGTPESEQRALRARSFLDAVPSDEPPHFTSWPLEEAAHAINP